ncbi:TetR/AcrR family transcriptional regulator [uncultured Subdoligranulum sp.]|uniref:TetR/AcrR family transcriptional regulator n=1 Tax=uncultured Subdoligranulum sp. TaxID=512298 RepID=UPI0025E453DB|nr:TetR/AcrR family transcriptional regulator [uncultured Subdoligranulum sp.]
MQKRARTAQAKQDRANAILDKARQMLLTTGYDRIKMADLAGALGLSSGTLYVYFQNKETLFLHLLRREFEQRMEHLEQEAAARDLSDFAGVRDLLLEALSYLLQDQLLYVYLETLRAQMLACGGDSARWMRSRLDQMLERLAERSVLSVPQLQELITAEAALLTGCFLQRMCTLGHAGTLQGWQDADFARRVLARARCYLDGYERGLQRAGQEVS